MDAGFEDVGGGFEGEIEVSWILSVAGIGLGVGFGAGAGAVLVVVVVVVVAVDVVVVAVAAVVVVVVAIGVDIGIVLGCAGLLVDNFVDGGVGVGVVDVLVVGRFMLVDLSGGISPLCVGRGFGS